MLLGGSLSKRFRSRWYLNWFPWISAVSEKCWSMRTGSSTLAQPSLQSNGGVNPWTCIFPAGCSSVTLIIWWCCCYALVTHQPVSTALMKMFSVAYWEAVVWVSIFSAAFAMLVCGCLLSLWGRLNFPSIEDTFKMYFHFCSRSIRVHGLYSHEVTYEVMESVSRIEWKEPCSSQLVLP